MSHKINPNLYALNVARALHKAGAPRSMFTADFFFMLRALAVAQNITLPYFQEIQETGRDGHYENKADGSPVTLADKGAEQAVRKLVENKRRGDGFVGEEYGELTPDGTDRRWIMDPVDGTAAFARGIPTWSSMIAMQEGGRTKLAAIAMPEVNHIWLAGEGHGAWRIDLHGGFALRARRIRIGDQKDITDSAGLFTSYSHLPPEKQKVLDALRNETDQVRQMGHAWGHMLVAEGAAAYAIGANLAPTWDAVPVSFIVQQAGGESRPVQGYNIGERVMLLSANAELFGRLDARLQKGLQRKGPSAPGDELAA